MNQNESILQYMKENGSITPIDAMSEFGCMRLAARIADLKEMGVAITKETERATNRYGEPVYYARYKLEGTKC